MKIRLITGLLLLVIILSGLYVFFGNNWLAEQQYMQKEKNQDFVRNDLMQRLLEIQDQSEEIINQLLNENYDMELIPQKDIALEMQPLFSVKSELSLVPQFDLKFFYLVMAENISVYNKGSLELEWKLDFEQEIIALALLDANRILVHTKNGRLICLNREHGNILWEKPEYEMPEKNNTFSGIREISLNKYHQLESSIIMVPDDLNLTLLNSINGDEIAKLKLEGKIDFISAFDQFERCVYLSSGKKLSKLLFKISY